VVKPLNRNSYNEIAHEWTAARAGFYGREREYLDMLLFGLAQGSSILDLGCGTGRPMAEYVISRGYRVVGIDQAESLLAQARAAFPHEEWVPSSIEAYAFQHDYSSAIFWDSLFHIERTRHAPILQRVVGGLPVGGRLMLTVGGSEHPPFTDVMFGQEFFYDSNSPGETEWILRDLGCRVLLGELMNQPTGGRDKGRYALVAERT
jgi:SAM-dependent methyltransferase